jgi:peptidoglycan-binding lysM
VFRRAVPLKDPETGEILGYEGQFAGKVKLVRNETILDERDKKKANNERDSEFDPPRVPASGMRSAGEYTDAELIRMGYMSADGSTVKGTPVPATVDVISTKEEIKAGDILVPEPPEEFRSYTPHAPLYPVNARVVSIYGPGVNYAGSLQVVAINKGLQDGVEKGQVLALYTVGKNIKDKTDGNRIIRLPDERNGIGMVFRVFDRVSYVLVMESLLPVEVGDKLINPTDMEGADIVN